MENQPEQNPPAAKEAPMAGSKNTCRLFTLVDTHGSRIQTVAALVQAVVAILMCLSLIQGCRAIQESHQTLLLTQRQLESTIEPRIDIVYGRPDYAAIQVEMPTNALSMATTLKTNLSVPIHRLETFVQSATNFTRVNFKNEGAVSVNNLEMLMAIEIATDESSNVTNVQTDDASELLAKCLKPDANVWHDFGNHPAIKRLINFEPPESRRRAVCFVLRYKRSVDMKPEVRYIFFLNGTVTGITNAFAIPFSPKIRTFMNMNAEAIEIKGRFKTAARQVVEQIDALGTDAN